MTSEGSKEITPAEARAGVKEGEELIWANCPHCNGRLAVYITRDSAAVAEPPKPEEKSVGN